MVTEGVTMISYVDEQQPLVSSDVDACWWALRSYDEQTTIQAPDIVTTTLIITFGLPVAADGSTPDCPVLSQVPGHYVASIGPPDWSLNSDLSLQSDVSTPVY
jgi:hypothetical protein